MPFEVARPPSSPISISGFLRQQDLTSNTHITSQDIALQPHSPTKAELESSSGGLFERPWASQPAKLNKREEPDTEADESWVLELLKDDDDDLAKRTKSELPIVAGQKLASEQLSSNQDSGEKHLPNKQLPEKQKATEGAPPKGVIPTDKRESNRLTSPHIATEISAESVESRQIDTSAIKHELPPRDVLAQSGSIPIKPTVLDEDSPVSTFVVTGVAQDEEPPASQVWIEPKEPEVQIFEPDLEENDEKKHGVVKDSNTAEAMALRDAIAAIQPEPLELEWRQEVSLFRRLLWPSLALTALLLVLAQVAWLEFHHLNRSEPYRSFYTIVCRTLQCTLPELIDRSKIQTYNLVVRSHPEAANALIMDVILQNNAPFEQSFPVLLLTFSDIENETSASGRLTPSEYLGGEMAGVEKMPVKQPIHIAIEIVDPGADVPNYSITITD